MEQRYFNFYYRNLTYKLKSNMINRKEEKKLFHLKSTYQTRSVMRETKNYKFLILLFFDVRKKERLKRVRYNISEIKCNLGFRRPDTSCESITEIILNEAKLNIKLNSFRFNHA